MRRPGLIFEGRVQACCIVPGGVGHVGQRAPTAGGGGRGRRGAGHTVSAAAAAAAAGRVQRSAGDNAIKQPADGRPAAGAAPKQCVDGAANKGGQAAAGLISGATTGWAQCTLRRLAQPGTG
jgi:hypothetical protein